MERAARNLRHAIVGHSSTPCSLNSTQTRKLRHLSPPRQSRNAPRSCIMGMGADSANRKLFWLLFTVLSLGAGFCLLAGG